MRLQGRSLVDGQASGEALVLDEPVSLWGGVDPASGVIIDAHHPQRGAAVTGRVLVMPAGRGSSSSASVLAEMVRLGTAPAAILVGEADLILAMGAEVARTLYGGAPPVVELPGAAAARLPDGAVIAIEATGEIRADILRQP